MVGRIYRARTCVKYKPGILEPYPILNVRLYNVLGEKFPEELEIPVDTGFEGSLMLRREDYEFFMVGELPREYWRTYRTLAGRVIMRVARAIAEINGVKLEVYVETPYYGYGRRLLGREILNKLVLVLDGIRHECCLAYS